MPGGVDLAPARRDVLGSGVRYAGAWAELGAAPWRASSSHARLLAAAIRERDPARMPDRARALVSHVLEEMGGFDLDGWRLRSGLSR
jgi:hypothetical protein